MIKKTILSFDKYSDVLNFSPVAPVAEAQSGTGLFRIKSYRHGKF